MVISKIGSFRGHL